MVSFALLVRARMIPALRRPAGGIHDLGNDFLGVPERSHRLHPCHTLGDSSSRQRSWQSSTIDMSPVNASRDIVIDVFISYAHADIEFVRTLVASLSALGLQARWDQNWSRVASKICDIEQNLIGGKTSLSVHWSKTSVSRPWVLEKPLRPTNRGKLVAVIIDDCEIPFGFRRIKRLDPAGWNGDRSTHGSVDLMTGVQSAASLCRANTKPVVETGAVGFQAEIARNSS